VWKAVASIARISVENSSVTDGSPKRVKAHPDLRPIGSDRAAEQLEQADLGRPARLIVEADHPARTHVVRVGDPASSYLEEPVQRCVERGSVLLLADDQPFVEPVLPEGASERTREDAGLQRRHPKPTVDVLVPGLLLRLDSEHQLAIPDHVPRRGGLARAPLRQVVGNPQLGVQFRVGEVVLDLHLVSRSIEQRPRLGRP
jgi:hypothetical protein